MSTGRTRSNRKVGFGDTTKYMTVMPLANRVSWLVNKEAWDSLPADLQQILTDEAKATGDAIQANWAEGSFMHGRRTGRRP